MNINPFNLTALFSLIAWSWVVIACYRTLFEALRRTTRLRHKPKQIAGRVYLLYFAGLVLFWLPLPILQTSLLEYWRSLQYTPSVALLLLVTVTMKNNSHVLSTQHPALISNSFLVITTIAALVLYPSALGLGYWDAYRLGYQPIFSACVSLLAASLWFFRHTSAALWLTSALAALLLGLYESENLWDILMDPIAAVWVLSSFIVRLKHYYDSNKACNTLSPTGQ